jgi:hypothetical protein
MDQHLSEDQIARILAGQATVLELRHARECRECEAQLKGFADTMSLFRDVVREGVSRRTAVHREFVWSASPPVFAGYRWILAACAAGALFLVPFIGTGDRSENPPLPAANEMDADIVMDRVNRHLARTVPEPLEPLMLGLQEANP